MFAGAEGVKTAAACATWYFSSANDPFGTGARKACIARATASKAAKARGRAMQRKFSGHRELAR